MSEKVELELYPEEVGALRGMVESYRRHFLPVGDDPEDRFIEKLAAGIHEKLRDIELPDEDSGEKSGDDDDVELTCICGECEIDEEELVEKGREQIEDGDYVALNDCENALDLEPAAWMELDDMGGAGLVPHLAKKRAERGTSDNNKPEFPKPLYYATSSDGHPPADGFVDEIRDRLQSIRSHVDTTKYTASSTIYLYRQIKQLEEDLEEFTQNGGSAAD